MDTRIISAFTLIISLALGAVMALVLLKRKAYPGYGQWVAACLCRAAGSALYLLPRDRFPPWLTIILPNFLLVFDPLLCLRGTQAFRGRRPIPWAMVAAFSLAFCLPFSLFVYAVPLLSARLEIFSATMIAVDFSLVAVLARNRAPYSDDFDLFQAAAWAFLGSLNLFRLAQTAVSGSPTLGSSELPPLQVAIVLASNVGTIFVCLTQVVMNGQRVEYDLGIAQGELERDIAEKERVELELRQAIAEKQILLRELYHRTKNSMQSIISMMNIVAAKHPEMTKEDFVADIARKIETMSLVHDKLCQARDLSQLDLGDYLEDLIKLSIYGNGLADQITMDLETERVLVSIEAAMPIGLVLCELVTNVIKHAFPAGERGEVALRLSREGGDIVLGFSDNGRGLPPGFDLASDRGFGLKMAYMIVEGQIGGTMAVESDRGTGFRIRFKSEALSRADGG